MASARGDEHQAIVKVIEFHNAARAGTLARAHTAAGANAILIHFKPARGQ
jgi:DNA-binding GntR family transcriptional regulator